MLESIIQNIINALQWGSFYALIALGYTLVYGVLTLINFAHGDVFMVGAYIAFFCRFIFPYITRFAGVGGIGTLYPIDNDFDLNGGSNTGTNSLSTVAEKRGSPPLCCYYRIDVRADSGTRQPSHAWR